MISGEGLERRRPLGRRLAAAMAFLAALALAAAPGGAQETADEGVRDAEAEEQPAKDLAFLRDCLDTLAARGAPARVCIEIVARSCASEPGGETTAGAVACEEREKDAWQALLLEAGQSLEQGMSNTERDRFTGAQEAWVAFRDAECAYEASLFEGGSLQDVERTACERRLTAERTIAIHERAADVEERTGE
jgi:uncharacterized protein YecT (DUF1311 family)